MKRSVNTNSIDTRSKKKNNFNDSRYSSTSSSTIDLSRNALTESPTQSPSISTTISDSKNDNHTDVIIKNSQSIGSINSSLFTTFMEKNIFYLDKTHHIEKVIDDTLQYFLFTRPRRFGKTLNLSTIDAFLNIEGKKTDNFFISIMKSLFNFNGKEADNLFEGLHISNNKDLCAKHQNKYPVIFLTLTKMDPPDPSYESALVKLARYMSVVYGRYPFLVESEKLNEEEKFFYKKVVSYKRMSPEEILKDRESISSTLVDLILMLSKYYNTQVVVLIDEYDAPLNKSIGNNYSEQMVNFMSSFLGDALKDLDKYVFKAVMVGITSISLSSIFSNLNNFRHYSVQDVEYSDFFGINEKELEKICEAKSYPLEPKSTIDQAEEASTHLEINSLKSWYNGYTFGNTTIYNPYSVLNFLSSPGKNFDSYWSNSANPRLIELFIKNNPANLAILYEIISKEGYPSETLPKNFTVFGTNLYLTLNFLSLLYSSGYITKKNKSFVAPNKEVFLELVQILRGFTNDKLSNGSNLARPLLNNDITTFKSNLKAYLRIFPSQVLNKGTLEHTYQGLLIASFCERKNEDYSVETELNSGKGRFDIAISPDPSLDDTTLVIVEVKRRKDGETFEKKLNEAIDQMQSNEYTQFYEDRYNKIKFNKILFLGIAFQANDYQLVSKLYTYDPLKKLKSEINTYCSLEEVDHEVEQLNA